MSGTYVGTYHGGNDFTGEDGFSVSRKLKSAAARNIGEASNGGSRAVVSSDGRRLLFDPRTERVLTVGDETRIVPRPAGAGSGFAGKPGARTRGPGGGGVRAPGPVTKGPGAPQFGKPGTKGPGVRGVVGGLGKPDRGLSPIMDVGQWGNLGLITSGPAFGMGDNTSDPYVVTTPPIITEGKGGNQRTAYQVFGVTIQPAPGFSDMGMIENRIGDDGPLTWLYQTVVGTADIINTVDFALGRPRASLNTEAIVESVNSIHLTGDGVPSTRGLLR